MRSTSFRKAKNHHGALLRYERSPSKSRRVMAPSIVCRGYLCCARGPCIKVACRQQSHMHEVWCRHWNKELKGCQDQQGNVQAYLRRRRQGMDINTSATRRSGWRTKHERMDAEIG